MNILEFANPSGWWWAALAAPIIAAYILRIRLRRRTVSTLLFWDKLFEEKKPRAWWRQLRHWLSLLLQLAFLALLVAALADPLWSWQKNQQRRVVLIIDNSASMSAREADGNSRLEKARLSAATLVRGLRGGDQMAVLTAGGRPRVELGMTDHQRSLLEAVQRVEPTDGPTDVKAAIDAGRRLLAEDDERGEILVVSDGCFDELEQVQAGEGVRVYGVAQQRDNVAITRFQARRSLRDATGYQTLIDVANFSAEPRTCRVELTLGDELIDVVPLDLEPGAAVTKILDHTSTAGGELTARLDVSDAMDSDNSAVALLPERKAIPVTLVTSGNLFLEGVLRSIPLVALDVVAEPPAAAPAGGVLVLDRATPAELPAGRVIVVDPQQDCDAWAVGDAIAQPLVASVDADSPLTQHVRLDNVTFPDARALEFRSEFERLISDPLDQPLLARLPRRSGDAIVLTCNLEQGDLPLRIAFPVLMKNTIEWFLGESGELRPAVAAGESLVIDIGASVAPEQDAPRAETVVDSDAPTASGVEAIVDRAAEKPLRQMSLVSPSDVAVPVTAAGERLAIGPLLETGVWTVRPATEAGETDAASVDVGPTTRVACNLVNAAESNLVPRGELTDVEGRDLLLLGGQPLWFYLTLLAATLIAVEWWLYQRRIVG